MRRYKKAGQTMLPWGRPEFEKIYLKWGQKYVVKSNERGLDCKRDKDSDTDISGF